MKAASTIRTSSWPVWAAASLLGLTLIAPSPLLAQGRRSGPDRTDVGRNNDERRDRSKDSEDKSAPQRGPERKVDDNKDNKDNKPATPPPAPERRVNTDERKPSTPPPAPERKVDDNKPTTPPPAPERRVIDNERRRDTGSGQDRRVNDNRDNRDNRDRTNTGGDQRPTPPPDPQRRVITPGPGPDRRGGGDWRPAPSRDPDRRNNTGWQPAPSRDTGQRGDIDRRAGDDRRGDIERRSDTDRRGDPGWRGDTSRGSGTDRRDDRWSRDDRRTPSADRRPVRSGDAGRLFTRSTEGRHFQNGVRIHEGSRYADPRVARFFRDHTGSYRYYAPAYSAVEVAFSPFRFYFGVCPPYVYRSHVWSAPPRVVYVDVPVYEGTEWRGYGGYGDEYYLGRPSNSLLWRDEPGLEDAVATLEDAFRYSDVAALVPLTDPGARIAVFAEGRYQYSMEADDYLDLTRDFMRTADTTGFTAYRVRQRASGVYQVFAKHTYWTGSGQSRTVYLCIVLERLGGRWTLTQIDMSPDRVDG